MIDHESPVFENIKHDIDTHDVVLFMKGSSAAPMCGFSATVVHILRLLEVPFQDVDVLQNQELRDGIKRFSDWPTIPQLYVRGEFIGGCDLVREMYETGELKQLLIEKGVLLSA